MTHLHQRNPPETPFGARLRAARKMAGLSMEDLASKLGGRVTKQAISKYEQGRMMPAPEVLERLVDVLKIATWGASPLRSADRELGEASLDESPALFELADAERPLLRRAGSLTRQRRTGEGADTRCFFSVNNEHLPKDTEDRTSDVASRAQHRALPQAAISEGLQSPALRRARCLRDWEAASAEAPLDRIRFRTGERLSSKMEAALKYRIADHLRRYLELEAILGRPEPFENPIAHRPVRSSEEVEEAATRTRDCWQLGRGPIVNLLGLLEDRGLKIYEARGIDGFEGLSGRCGEAVFIAVSMEAQAERIRFTAAHELGHVLCDFEAAGAESPESECHAFGAAFLLPRVALERVFMPARRKVTLGDLAEIKETFGVSLQAIMRRAHDLGFVTDRQLRSFRETLREKDWLVREPVAYEGKEQATRFRRLLHYAVAADVIDVARAAELAGMTPEALGEEIGDVF